MELNKTENENVKDIKNNENNEGKEPMTTKQKVFFGLKIAGNVLFYALLFFLFLFAIFNINGGNGTDNFPHIFGSGYLSVQSDSMKRNENKQMIDGWSDYEIGGFEKGDLLKVSVFDESDADTDHLKVGMVITFVFNVSSTEKALNTHRIVYIKADDSGKILAVVTQGDKAAQDQPYLVAGSKYAEGKTEQEIASYNFNLEQSGVVESVSLSSIRGIVKSVTVGGGKVLDNIRSNYLFYFVLPVAVLLILEIFFVVRNIMILRGEKNKAELEGTREAMLADVEAEKEKMRQELLAEMRAQGLVVAEEPKKEEVVETKEEVVEEVKEETTEVVEEKSTETVEETKVEENKEVEETTESNEKEEEAKEASEE